MKTFRLIAYAVLIGIGVLVVQAQEHGIQWTRSAYHIAAKGTYTATFSSTSALSTFNVNISNAGTSWVLSLQNRESTPKILWQWATADGVGNFNIPLDVGILMTDGIKVVSSGTTAGVADIELSYRGAANPSATPFATPTATYTPTPTPTATYTPTPTPTPE